MQIRVLESGLSDGETIEVINIDFDIERLEITVLIDGDKIDISFAHPVGYRVLDEGHLLEFWPSCSSPHGWLYEILEGGWLEQESQRKGFLSVDNSELREYFVVGTNYCVGVFSWEAPSVCQSIR